MAFNKKYYNSYLKAKLGPDHIPFVFEDDDSFWIPVIGKNDKTKELQTNGFVRISVTVMPKEM